MKKQLRPHILLTAALVLLGALSFNSSAGAQTVTPRKTADEAKQSAGKGVIFKIPDNFTPMEKWADIKGILMLNLKQPAGAFVAYPNENESPEDLMTRIRASIAPMFIHEKEAKFDWQTAALPVHAGDKTARMDIAASGKQTVQVAFYKREANGLPFVYGYFAMKSDKPLDKGVWLNADGSGVKSFDKLWKSFPKN